MKKTMFTALGASALLLTGLAFLGLSIPGFLLALILLYVGGVVLRLPVGGVISSEFANPPMSAAKALDYFNYLWPPALILALAGAAPAQGQEHQHQQKHD